MKHRSLLALLLLALFASGLFAFQAEPEKEPPQPVTVILVRHAEKQTVPTDDRDPALTDEGSARAVTLARLLGNANVTHLFSTEYRRTRATLAPLAEATGLEVETVSAPEAARQIELLRALPPGSTAVVAGHSNTVPAFVMQLGGEVANLVKTRHGPCLGDDEYDRLFFVTLPVGDGAATKTTELRYGE